MVVYRITHKKWANTLTASGYAARWNSNGIYILYTASSQSLACLENIVHRESIGLNALFEVMHIEIPPRFKIKEITINSLPENWNSPTERGHMICREIGDNWFKSQSSCLLKVPSAIIPEEYNYLINCSHKDFSKIKIVKHHSFSFDSRLKK